MVQGKIYEQKTTGDGWEHTLISFEERQFIVRKECIFFLYICIYIYNNYLYVKKNYRMNHSNIISFRFLLHCALWLYMTLASFSFSINSSTEFNFTPGGLVFGSSSDIVFN